jgi:hypothetical protein
MHNAHRAAQFAWLGPLLTTLLALGVAQNTESRSLPLWCALFGLSLLALSLAAAVFALLSIRRFGTAHVLFPAIVGLIASILAAALLTGAYLRNSSGG